MKRAEGLGDYHSQVAEYQEFVQNVAPDARDEEIKQHPNLINWDGESVMFGLGDEHIVRISPSHWSDAHFGPHGEQEMRTDELMRRRITALDCALGKTGLEQLVAYDMTMPAVVTERVRDHVEYDHSRYGVRLSADDFRTLFDGFELLESLGLCYDACTPDTLYVPHEGFTIVNYDIAQTDYPSPTTAQDSVVIFGSDLVATDPRGTIDNARQLYVTAGERYGFGVTTALEQSWEEVGFTL